jgi:hypothetical protein
MMSSPNFLDYEVALMLAKYGKRNLLNALAQKLDMTTDQLEVLLRTPPRKRPATRPGGRHSSQDILNQLVSEYPEKGYQLQRLHERFLNRTFLPELRDTRRFLEEHSRPAGTLKSRAASVEKVLRLLADLHLEELESLSQSRGEDEYSSLAVISDAILHRDR